MDSAERAISHFPQPAGSAPRPATARSGSLAQHYAPGETVLPRGARLWLRAYVVRGQIAVVAGRPHGRAVVGRVERHQAVDSRAYGRPVELIATQETWLRVLSLERRAAAGPTPPPAPARPRLLLGAVVPLALALGLVLAAPCWQRPARSVLARLAYGLGSECLRRGEYGRAASLLQASSRLDASLTWAWNDAGYTCYRRGQVAAAEAAFRQAIAADPAYAPAYNNLGLLLLEQGRPVEAAAVLRQSLAADPGLAAAWANLGVVEQHRGRAADAARAYRAALRIDPEQATIQANLGVIDYENRDLAAAQGHLAAALAAGPDLPQARLLLGAISLEQGDRDRAWRYFQAVDDVLADDPSLHFYLALWYERAGMWQGAYDELRRVLALHPPPDLDLLARSHLAALPPAGNTTLKGE